MARYIGPKTRISRKFGVYILGSIKAFKRKNYRPGQHGKKHKRTSTSDYDIQQQEKQKAKWRYGLLERQFRNLVRKARRLKGISDDILMQLLEMRLDVIVFRLGICPTVAAARQLVVHRHIKVNGCRVDRPSYTLDKGDIVTLAEKAKKFVAVLNSLSGDKPSYPWLAWDNPKMHGVVLEVPDRKSIPQEINAKMIIEFYAR